MGKEIQEIYESPGQLLFIRRNELSLELTDLQDKLKIPKRYLQALEMEQYQKLPPLVYSRQIVKKYVTFLSLDGYGITEAYLERMEEYIRSIPSKSVLPFRDAYFSRNLFDVSRIFKFGIATMVLAFSIFYFFWQIQATFRPPFLEIYQPDDQTVIVDDAIMVVGRSEPETEVSINDALVIGDREGNFVTTVHLRPGVNMITVTARKKHGTEARLQRQIFMQQEVKASILNDPEMSNNYLRSLF